MDNDCPLNLSIYSIMSVFYGIEHWFLSNYCCRLHIINSVLGNQLIEFSPVHPYPLRDQYGFLLYVFDALTTGDERLTSY